LQVFVGEFVGGIVSIPIPGTNVEDQLLWFADNLMDPCAGDKFWWLQRIDANPRSFI